MMLVEIAQPVWVAQFLPALAALASLAGTGVSLASAFKDPPEPPTNQLPPQPTGSVVGTDLRREALRRGRASTINPVVTGASELLNEFDEASTTSNALLGG